MNNIGIFIPSIFTNCDEATAHFSFIKLIIMKILLISTSLIISLIIILLRINIHEIMKMYPQIHWLKYLPIICGLFFSIILFSTSYILRNQKSKNK